VVWRKTLDQSVSLFAGADGDGDGVVDQDDYGVWRTNFGRTIGAASGEPGAGSQAAAAALANAAAPVGEAQDTSAIVAAGQVRLGGSSTSSGTPMQPVARAEPVPGGIRDSVEPSPSPARPSSPQASLRERGIARSTEDDEGALADLLEARSRRAEAAIENSIRPMGHARMLEARDSQLSDALDEAFASCVSWPLSVTLSGLCGA
jgi:hypothetical protein